MFNVNLAEWNATSFIKIWYWPRNQIPADITAKTPDPSTWGTCVSPLVALSPLILIFFRYIRPYFYKSFGPQCPNSYFAEHQILVDTYLCGVYAGFSLYSLPLSLSLIDCQIIGNSYVWGDACQALTGVSTCNAWVQNNPQNFTEAYWSINYIRVRLPLAC